MPRHRRASDSLFHELAGASFRELMHDRPAPGEREPSQVKLQRCPVCHEYLTDGSTRLGECGACGVRLPAWFV